MYVAGDASAAGAGKCLDGYAQDVRVYNRILTAAEVATLYNSRLQRVILNGLVFWCPCNGAAGAVDGTTLGASNTLSDVIGGAVGTPSGSPILRGNTNQTIGGE